MKKKAIIAFMMFAAMGACTPPQRNQKRSSTDSTPIEDTIVEGEIPEEHATYYHKTDTWSGPGSDRINRLWKGHVYLDTIAHKWIWNITEGEKRKLSKEDVYLMDSLLYKFNND